MIDATIQATPPAPLHMAGNLGFVMGHRWPDPPLCADGRAAAGPPPDNTWRTAWQMIKIDALYLFVKKPISLILSIRGIKLVLTGWDHFFAGYLDEAEVTGGSHDMLTPLGRVVVLAPDWNGEFWISDDDNRLFLCEWEGGGGNYKEVPHYSFGRGTWHPM
jgi:hypothetical protein